MTAEVAIGCARCQCVFTTAGDLMEHLRLLHMETDLQAEHEAAEAAMRCPSCTKRGGVHLPRCRRPGWRPGEAAR